MAVRLHRLLRHVDEHVEYGIAACPGAALRRAHSANANQQAAHFYHRPLAERHDLVARAFDPGPTASEPDHISMSGSQPHTVDGAVFHALAQVPGADPPSHGQHGGGLGETV